MSSTEYEAIPGRFEGDGERGDAAMRQTILTVLVACGCLLAGAALSLLVGSDLPWSDTSRTFALNHYDLAVRLTGSMFVVTSIGLLVVFLVLLTGVPGPRSGRIIRALFAAFALTALGLGAYSGPGVDAAQRSFTDRIEAKYGISVTSYEYGNQRTEWTIDGQRRQCDSRQADRLDDPVLKCLAPDPEDQEPSELGPVR